MCACVMWTRAAPPPSNTTSTLECETAALQMLRREMVSTMLPFEMMMNLTTGRHVTIRAQLCDKSKEGDLMEVRSTQLVHSVGAGDIHTHIHTTTTIGASAMPVTLLVSSLKCVDTLVCETRMHSRKKNTQHWDLFVGSDTAVPPGSPGAWLR